MNSPYAYRIEVFNAEGSPLGCAALAIDWEPAREWTRFAAVRDGLVAPNAVDSATAVEPVWHPKAGEPYVDGFRLAMTIDDRDVAREFTTEYIAGFARAAVAKLREKREPDQTPDQKAETPQPESVRYVTTAYRPAAESGASPTAAGFRAREIAPELVIKEGAVEDIAPGAVPHGDASPGELPVLVPRRVLDEAATLTRSVDAQETGGILLGHLRRDLNGGQLFAEVTAQVPARHTQADLTTLSFTAETWTDVRAAMTLRGQGELMLGWWHSHPVQHWCKSCSPERQRTCSLAAGFLSEHDRALHRTVFPRAYSLALVVNDVAVDGPTFTLFGWHEGVLTRRGFSVW